MSIARAGTPGATRVCPHCKAVVLETAAVCPGCRHHLRFNATDVSAAEAYCAFNIEGTIAHKQTGEHCEYCIVLDIRNERGEQILRQVVGVGALHPGELRRLNLAVEMLPVRAAVAPKNEQANTRDPRRPAAPSIAARAPASSPAPTPAPVPSRPPAPAAATTLTGAAAPTATATPSPAAASTPLMSPAAKAKPPAPLPPVSAAPGKASTPAEPIRHPGTAKSAAEAPSAPGDQLRLFRKP